MILISRRRLRRRRPARNNGPDPIGQVRDVLITTLRTQLVQRPLQAQQVVAVQPARALAPVDVLGQRLHLLRAGELVVVGRPDVHERADGPGRRALRRVEGRVVDRVPVDLPDVQILLDLCYVVPLDAVRGAPDLFRRRGMVVRQLLPEGSLDQRDDAARRVWRPAVVLALRSGERLLVS